MLGRSGVQPTGYMAYSATLGGSVVKVQLSYKHYQPGLALLLPRTRTSSL
jgi:hypothetical protein